MSAPSFGDRAKLKVPIMPSDLAKGSPREPGEVGLVVQAPWLVDGIFVVRVLFEGDAQPNRVRAVDVTTDLTWVTPRQAAIVGAFERVLIKEDVAKQRGRANRIAGLLLAAYDEGLNDFAQAEERRAQREASEAEREAEERRAATETGPETED